MKRSASICLVVTVVAICGVSVVTGCGGGGEGTKTTPSPLPSIPATPPPAPTAVVPRMTISWGERSRATGGLNSALSAVVRLQGARSDGNDLIFTVNRAASPGSHAITVNAPAAVRVGPLPFSVTFYAESEGEGALVGMAQAMVNLPADGALPEVSVAAMISHVEVTAGQRVLVGQKSDLLWTARAHDNSLVPVTPGSGLFSLGSGVDRLRLRDGQAEGLLPGMASVIARVDGVSSAPMPVQVTSNAVVRVAPHPTTVVANSCVDFTAQVSETENQNVSWSVLEVGGGSITMEGRYTAPAKAGVYSVCAVSQYDPEKSAIVNVIVQDSSSEGGELPPSGNIGVEID